MKTRLLQCVVGFYLVCAGVVIYDIPEKDTAKFSGYLLHYSEINRNGYVILRNSFNQTLKEREIHERKMGRSGTGIPLLWQHETDKPIGIITKFEDRHDGLFVYGEINLKTQLGREAYELFKGNSLNSLSVGFFVNAGLCIVTGNDGDCDRSLVLKGEIIEASIVTMPADRKAAITLNREDR